MNTWDTIEYQKISTVTLNGSILSVQFANGDLVDLPISSLFPVGKEEFKPSLIENKEYEISLSDGSTEVIIPWDKIRVISDESFARAMAEQAEENAKLVGSRIKQLRERHNLKANELALRSGVTAQTISRIENGHTDINFATLRKILAAMGYSLKDLARQEAIVEDNKPVASFADLIQKLNKIGLDTSIVNKIIPKSVRDQASKQKDKLTSLLQNEIALYFHKVFGWKQAELFSNTSLEFNQSAAQWALFKTPSRGNISQIRAYSHYAYYLAGIVNSLNTAKPKLEYPGDIDEFKAEFSSLYKELSLYNLINFAWDLGIAVLPLNDQGVFHGACWNIHGKHVIVLKQKNQSHARWTFDLLHEFYHVFVHLDTENSSVVEFDEVNPFGNNNSIEEQEANAFASQVIFKEKPEALTAEVMNRANFKVEQLKGAVATVAREFGAPSDFLANYIAFRLQTSKVNWWPTASSFQTTEPDPFLIAKEILYKRTKIETLNAIDNNLITSALN